MLLFRLVFCLFWLFRNTETPCFDIKRNNRNKPLVLDSAETSFSSCFGSFGTKLVLEDTLVWILRGGYTTEIDLSFSHSKDLDPSVYVTLQSFIPLCRSLCRVWFLFLVTLESSNPLCIWHFKEQCYKIFWHWFFSPKTSSSPLDMCRKDFKFLCRIFEELFVFVIDSLVYFPPECWDSPVIDTLGSLPKLVYRKKLLVQKHQGVILDTG